METMICDENLMKSEVRRRKNAMSLIVGKASTSMYVSDDCMLVTTMWKVDDK